MDKKYLCLAIFAACVIAGCVAWIGFYDNSKKALAEDVAHFDRGCPVEMAPGNVIESVYYDADANNVNMRIAVTNAATAQSEYKAVHADKVTLMFQAPEYRNFLKSMVKAKVGLTLSYVAAAGETIYKDAGVAYVDSLDEAMIHLTPEDVAVIERKPLLSGKERALISLSNRAVMISGICPVEWGEGSVLENVGVDDAGKRLSVYIMSEKTGSPEYQAKLFKSELKAHRRDMALVHNLVKELAAAGYGIKVCYLGQDKATIEREIDIPASDIYNISQLR